MNFDLASPSLASLSKGRKGKKPALKSKSKSQGAHASAERGHRVRQASQVSAIDGDGSHVDTGAGNAGGEVGSLKVGDDGARVGAKAVAKVVAENGVGLGGTGGGVASKGVVGGAKGGGKTGGKEKVPGTRARNVSQTSRSLPPVEKPPVKVLLAEPLSERKARLQRGGGRKKRSRPGDSGKVGEKAGEEEDEQAATEEVGVSDTKKKRGNVRSATKSKAGGKQRVAVDGDVTEGPSTTMDQPSSALTTTDAGAKQGTEKENTKDNNGGIHNTTSLADLPLDPEGWSLKDIVKWGSARERRLAKESAKLAPKPVPPPAAPVQPSSQATLTPKVRVVDGKIVVDEESLTVAAQQKEEYTKVVTEESHTINSMSYVNRLSNDRWSVEDTELFFRALSQFGTDFSLMAMLFPGRMRKHLKKKFCKESKVSPERIDAAMRASAHATLGSYREMIDLLKNTTKGIKNNS